MTAIHIALTVTIYFEPKMRKIIFTKFVLIFLPLNVALLRKKLCILDVYHILLRRRDVKAYYNHLNFDICQN